MNEEEKKICVEIVADGMVKVGSGIKDLLENTSKGDLNLIVSCIDELKDIVDIYWEDTIRAMIDLLRAYEKEEGENHWLM